MSTESSDDTIGADEDEPAADAGSERGIGDILGEEVAQQYVKYNVGVFGAIGVGFGLALVLMDALAGAESTLGGAMGSAAALGLFIALFLTPAIAGITGTLTSLHYDDEEKAVASVAAAGAFLGYVAVLVLTIVTASVIGDGGGGGSSAFTDSLAPLIGYGIGVAAAGAIGAVVTERFA